MKYITVPEPLELEFAVNPGGSPVLYGIYDFLNEFVFVSPKFRDPNDPEMQLCAIRLFEKFKTACPGDVIDMQDRDHEKLLKVAALQDEKLPPHIAILVMKMLVVISSAQDNPPSKS